MNAIDSKRLSEIRADLLQHEAAGVDVSGWHDTFFIRLVDEQAAELRRLKKERV